MVEMEMAMETSVQRQPLLYEIANQPNILFFMPKSVARRYSNEEEDLELDQFKLSQLKHDNQYDHVAWAHKHLSGVLVHKLRKYYARTLDQNADGVINWSDFEIVINNMISQEDANNDSRVAALRRILENDLRKYWKSLCETGDKNLDGNVDLEEWLEVLDEIVHGVRQNGTFPEWYEDLMRVLYRTQEFADQNNVSRQEFIDMLATWNFDEAPSGKAFDYITQNGAKKLNYELFLDFMKQFHTNDKQGHPVNCGLDL